MVFDLGSDLLFFARSLGDWIASRARDDEGVCSTGLAEDVYSYCYKCWS